MNNKIIAWTTVFTSLAFTADALASDWSSNSVGYRYVPDQSEPGVASKVSKNVLSFTHVSGDKLGGNFFTIDLLKSSKNDPANGNSQGAQEWYGFYQRSFSLGAMTGNKEGYGFAKDLKLTARLDAGSKNTFFAPSPLKLRLGIAADLPVAAGFWDMGLGVMKESNNNGIVGKSVSFKAAPALSTAFAIPAFGLGAFTGFADVIGPKGKDGFGARTKTETLARVTYMFDIGGPKSGIAAGLGVEYWNNKFGCNNAASFVKNSCTATSGLLALEYKF